MRSRPTALRVDDASGRQLLFAQNLDGGGRLDLVCDISDHCNVSLPTLFLSLRAIDGALVGDAMHHESTGC